MKKEIKTIPIYEIIDWKDAPSQQTPINAENLNKMDSQIETTTNEIISLDNWKMNLNQTIPLNNFIDGAGKNNGQHKMYVADGTDGDFIAFKDKSGG